MPPRDDRGPVFSGDPPASWWESWSVAIVAAVVVLVGLAVFLFYTSVYPGN